MRTPHQFLASAALSLAIQAIAAPGSMSGDVSAIDDGAAPGGVPVAALVIGAGSAVWGWRTVMSTGGSVKDAIFTAWLMFGIGALLGLPVSCAFHSP